MLNQPQASRTERLVIGFAGRIGAGKTSAATYLGSRHGFQYVRYSQILSEWLANDSAKKFQLQEIGWKVMAGGMQPELNSRLIAQVRATGDVAVDGLRHTVDRESLEESYSGLFHLVYIECAPKMRWQHLKEHGRYADFASFQAADSHPVEQQIENLRATAALVLENASSFEKLYAKLDSALLAFRKGGHT